MGFLSSPTASHPPFISHSCHQLRNIHGRKKGTYASVKCIYSWLSLPECSAAKLQGFAPAQHSHHMDTLLHNDVSPSLSLLCLTRDDLKNQTALCVTKRLEILKRDTHRILPRNVQAYFCSLCVFLSDWCNLEYAQNDSIWGHSNKYSLL